MGKMEKAVAEVLEDLDSADWRQIAAAAAVLTGAHAQLMARWSLIQAACDHEQMRIDGTTRCCEECGYYRLATVDDTRQ